MNGPAAQVFAWCRAGRAITASWEAGGDETIVDIRVDGERVHWSDDTAKWLTGLIVDALELPNAGSYYVDGVGALSCEGDAIALSHESVRSGVRWDPKTNEEHDVGREVVQATLILWRA